MTEPQVTAWPDSVGAWWCNKLPDVPHPFSGSKLWIDRWRDRESFEAEYGAARFTKCREQNPFTSKEG